VGLRGRVLGRLGLGVREVRFQDPPQAPAGAQRAAVGVAAGAVAGAAWYVRRRRASA